MAWITLHEAVTGGVLMLNLNRACVVVKRRVGGGSVVVCGGEDQWEVREEMAEVRLKIEATGVEVEG